MAVLATYNVKGGVGKTATVVNLAYRAAVTGQGDGARTLIFDLDPQGAASYYLRANPKVKRTGKALMRAKQDVDGAIVPTDFEGLDLVPADFSFRNVDVVLDGTKNPTERLARVVRPLARRYEYLFFDCPPSISRLSENVFGAADALLIPLIPTTLSVRSLEQLRDFLSKWDGRRPQLLPFFSMVDRRKRLHKELIGELSAARLGILSSVVPAASAVENMGPHQAPVAAFAPRTAPARAYATMWSEIVARLDGD